MQAELQAADVLQPPMPVQGASDVAAVHTRVRADRHKRDLLAKDLPPRKRRRVEEAATERLRPRLVTSVAHAALARVAALNE